MPKSLQESLFEISESVEPVIRSLLVESVDPANSRAVIYQCQSGGKRIRPALVVLSGRLFGGDFKGLLYPAASVEILHNSTLIVDDMIDHAETRRNQPTTWKKYGHSVAQCITLDYLASVFYGLSRVKNGQRIAELYADTLKTVVDGEFKDILFERQGHEDEPFIVEHRYKTITKNDYFQMIGQKTAALLQACCEAGAIYAGASNEQTKLVGQFGYNLGIAFQLRDDLLDIFGDESKFGKKIGKDIVEKKMGNYVILTAIEMLGPTDRRAAINVLEADKPVSDENIRMMISLIRKTGAKRTVENAVEKYIGDALTILGKLPENEFNEKLMKLAYYLADRKA